eukprot:1113181_1
MQILPYQSIEFDIDIHSICSHGIDNGIGGNNCNILMIGNSAGRAGGLWTRRQIATGELSWQPRFASNENVNNVISITDPAPTVGNHHFSMFISPNQVTVSIDGVISYNSSSDYNRSDYLGITYDIAFSGSNFGEWLSADATVSKIKLHSHYVDLNGCETSDPTTEPTTDPTLEPTTEPTLGPTVATINPTKGPTNDPTANPSENPTYDPCAYLTDFDQQTPLLITEDQTLATMQILPYQSIEFDVDIHSICSHGIDNGGGANDCNILWIGTNAAKTDRVFGLWTRRRIATGQLSWEPRFASNENWNHATSITDPAPTVGGHHFSMIISPNQVFISIDSVMSYNSSSNYNRSEYFGITYNITFSSPDWNEWRSADATVSNITFNSWISNMDGCDTAEPTTEPTTEPTLEPTLNPTNNPTDDPTINPTVNPTINPTINPTVNPTINPTVNPTINPT